MRKKYKQPAAEVFDAPHGIAADFVFDTPTAMAWITQGYQRREKLYHSVQVDAPGLSERHSKEAVRLAALAVRDGGLLYLPDKLSHLADVQPALRLVEKLGGWAVYRVN